jgi:hypothetical protein
MERSFHLAAFIAEIHPDMESLSGRLSFGHCPEKTGGDLDFEIGLQRQWGLDEQEKAE